MDFFEIYVVHDDQQNTVKIGGYASILAGVMTPDRSDKWNYLVSAQLHKFK